MKKVLVTRPAGQSAPFIAALSEAGFEAIPFPVIEIAPLDDPSALDAALRGLESCDWLVLTSVNGVEAVWKRLEVLGITHLPERLKIAAIGPKTAAALAGRNAAPDFVPGEYIAEAILPGLGDLHGLGDLPGKRVLLARAEIARQGLTEAIRHTGGDALEVAAYRTLPARPDPAGIEALRRGVDIITFTSSSTVRNFAALVRSAGLDPRRLPGSPLFACIGPITTATAEEEGLPPAIVASKYTAEGLVEAITLAVSP